MKNFDFFCDKLLKLAIFSLIDWRNSRYFSTIVVGDFCDFFIATDYKFCKFFPLANVSRNSRFFFPVIFAKFLDCFLRPIDEIFYLFQKYFDKIHYFFLRSFIEIRDFLFTINWPNSSFFAHYLVKPLIFSVVVLLNWWSFYLRKFGKIHNFFFPYATDSYIFFNQLLK